MICSAYRSLPPFLEMLLCGSLFFVTAGIFAWVKFLIVARKMKKQNWAQIVWLWQWLIRESMSTSTTAVFSLLLCLVHFAILGHCSDSLRRAGMEMSSVWCPWCDSSQCAGVWSAWTPSPVHLGLLKASLLRKSIGMKFWHRVLAFTIQTRGRDRPGGTPLLPLPFLIIPFQRLNELTSLIPHLCLPPFAQGTTLALSSVPAAPLELSLHWKIVVLQVWQSRDCPLERWPGDVTGDRGVDLTFMPLKIIVEWFLKREILNPPLCVIIWSYLCVSREIQIHF